ncbi:MAG: MinD/ParA family protein [Brevinema sp.]
MSGYIDSSQDLKQFINQENSRTRIITITSGKGGVGKSNFALNLAIAIANITDSNNTPQRHRVVIMDADLGLANVNVLLGLIPKTNLYHVLKGQKTLKEIIIPTSFGIDLIAGASGLSQLANLSEEERLNFIKEIVQLNYADFLIIDTAAGVSSNVTQFAAIAHDTIVVTTPEPTSITDAYGVIKSIALEHQNTPNLKLVVNKASSQKEAEKVASKIISISKGFLNIELLPLGYIPDSPIVSSAVRKQIPFSILSPGSNVAQGVEQIARKLLNIHHQGSTNSGWKNFLTYLLGND